MSEPIDDCVVRQLLNSCREIEEIIRATEDPLKAPILLEGDNLLLTFFEQASHCRIFFLHFIFMTSLVHDGSQAAHRT